MLYRRKSGKRRLYSVRMVRRKRSALARIRGAREKPPDRLARKVFAPQIRPRRGDRTPQKMGRSSREQMDCARDEKLARAPFALRAERRQALKSKRATARLRGFCARVGVCTKTAKTICTTPSTRWFWRSARKGWCSVWGRCRKRAKFGHRAATRRKRPTKRPARLSKQNTAAAKTSRRSFALGRGFATTRWRKKARFSCRVRRFAE